MSFAGTVLQHIFAVRIGERFLKAADARATKMLPIVLFFFHLENKIREILMSGIIKFQVTINQSTNHFGQKYLIDTHKHLSLMRGNESEP